MPQRGHKKRKKKKNTIRPLSWRIPTSAGYYFGIASCHRMRKSCLPDLKPTEMSRSGIFTIEIMVKIRIKKFSIYVFKEIKS
jgi:hypothetical protein